MKTMSKKLASIVLALCLCFSLVGTALAASSSTDTDFSITVTKAADGETYSAYKIFDVTYSYDGDAKDGIYSYTIDEDSAWYEYVKAATDVFTLTQVGESSTWIVTVNDDVEDDAIIAVFTDAAKTIDFDELDADATTTASNGTAVLDVTDSGAGYYYVTTSLGSLVIIDTTNPTQEIEEKNGTPTISKWVHENTAEEGEWGHEDDANNADTILFEIEIDNINGAVNLVLHDSMDDELEIPDESDFHLSSIVLYTSSDADPIELTEGTYDEATKTGTGDYYITVGDCTVEGCQLTNCAFEIHFLRSFDDVDSTGYIELTYELLLDTENDAYTGDYEEIDNNAQISFGTSSFSAVVQAETFSFGFETHKYDGESQENLEGVEFELTSTSGTTAYFLEENVDGRKVIYLFEGWGDAPDGYTNTLVTGSDGMIYIEGLDTGTYILEETKALDGYNQLTDTVTVTIDATYDEDTGAMLTHTVTYTYGDVEDEEGTVEIANYSGTILPDTGGMGTTIFYIIGGVLVAGAVVVLITRRRMSSNEG